MSPSRPATPPAAAAWLAPTVALLVVVAGLTEVGRDERMSDARHVAGVAIVLATALACALFRRAPGLALGLLLATGLFQVATGAALLAVQLTAPLVAYGTSRYGSTLVVWLSGVALPFAPVFAFMYLGSDGMYVSSDLVTLVLSSGGGHLVGPALVGFGSLAYFLLPWFLGLVLRGRERTRASRRDEQAALAALDEAREQRAAATEIARLQAGNARLARDVHDVVGHSLAVILAQAESAQLLADDDPDAAKRAMASIAGSARQSLRDVRAVLGSTGTPTPAGLLPQGSLQSLIDDVRTAGVQVEDTESGEARDLTLEEQTVAFRVLQEMLTNALKHGRRDHAVTVRRAWSTEPVPSGRAGRTSSLLVEVANTVSPEAERGVGGLGIAGLRQRLEPFGGHLSVRTAPLPDGSATFTASAHLPLS
ncbi:sensor histidine kinase [Oerskovia sp. NPDC057915]|uniref:sensor histidine kinase n=1 Tax=Oerskovia sp. NPDC057915 TaxID=3346280 RepID=UPI0036D7DB39